MLTAEELLEFLPRTDCGQCGMTCADFAGLLLSRDLSPADCPVLHEPEYAGFIEALEELLAAAPAARRGMAIDPARCTGCGICVAMCEHHLAQVPEARAGRGPRPGDRVIFRVVNGQVAVVNQEQCVRLLQAAEKCSKCAEHCPTEAITLT